MGMTPAEDKRVEPWLLEKIDAFDVDEAVAKMTKHTWDYYSTCFKRYDTNSSGALDAQEMQRMMKDMGLAPRSTSEQKVYAKLLEDIAQRSDGDRNPLVEGGWTFDEFLLMITVMTEVSRVQEEHQL